MFHQLILLISLLANPIQSYQISFDVGFQWSYVNFTWPSIETYRNALEDKSYVKENITITSAKPWREKMFLTLPRWKSGVPVTLASVSIDHFGSPLLESFPNWEKQKQGDCKAFQSITALEIDNEDRMWIVDEGQNNLMGNSSTKCPPKLVIFDLNSKSEISEYNFTRDAKPSDIVLDLQDGGYAYITDSNPLDPAIIVYSLKNNVAWRKADVTMKADPKVKYFTVETTRITGNFAINSIALSPPSGDGDRFVYYAPISSYKVYKVTTKNLKDPNNEKIRVSTSGRLPSTIDGMIMSNLSFMFFGLLENNAISVWNSTSNVQDKRSFELNLQPLVKNSTLLQWPASFAFDNLGFLWCISNRFQNFFGNAVNTSEINFRVVYAFVNQSSYQYRDHNSKSVTTQPPISLIEKSTTTMTTLSRSTASVVLSSQRPPTNEQKPTIPSSASAVEIQLITLAILTTSLFVL